MASTLFIQFLNKFLRDFHAYKCIQACMILTSLHTSSSCKLYWLSQSFWSFCQGFSYQSFIWVFICLHKGLLNLYQQICVFIIFVSPLTFILETLKLICDESWDLCMFNKLCMLMRVHYAMLCMFNKLCMLLRVHYAMLHMFDKLCMFMQVHYAMICKFNKLCMYMQVHYAKLCKSNMLCMFIMICKIHHVCCAKFPLSILYAL